ncbi:MAG: DivIVA domain-containing protein [Eubacteriales bacterium]|nr:DivIVA domain-containing protein [Eubacteriales bacterium]
MSLTVKDILEMTFKRSFKGYDEDEVDKFLDQIIDELKVLQSENTRLINELNDLKQRDKKIKDAEETIMHTLVSAQKSSERILNEAARKAELILDNAENTARQRTEQTTRELAEAERRLKEVRANAQSFATSFANMINSSAATFEKMYRSYFGDDDSVARGGINTEALERIEQDLSSGLKDIDESGLEEEPEAGPVSEPEAASEQEIEIITVPEEAEAEAASEPEAETEAVSEPETEPEAASEPEAETEAVSEPETEPEAVSEPETKAEPKKKPKKKGLMELHEINKVLSDLEKGDDILQDSYEDDSIEQDDKEDKTKTAGLGGYKPKYDDYSWLYENDDKTDGNFELSLKDPKDKDELKSLIDEIIE